MMERFAKIQKQAPELFYSKGVPRNVAGLRPATVVKKRLWHRCFPANITKFLRTPFLQNNSGQLPLKINNGF